MVKFNKQLVYKQTRQKLIGQNKELVTNQLKKIIRLWETSQKSEIYGYE